MLNDAQMADVRDHVSAALGVDFLAGIDLPFYEI
jgi:hypothetical protein